VTSPAAPFTDATLTISTSPGANCSIMVRYKSGPSRAKGLIPKVADGSGRVSWTWRVGSNTTPGRWPIVVTCEKGMDRGELRTSFEVG
jgi:micrococcal nuclease